MSRFDEERVNKMFDGIQSIILKCFKAVKDKISKDKHCFELYGYDILIDDDLKPWLIEINSNASLTASTELDAETKIKMLDDLLTILDLEKVMTGNENQIGGWDVICRGNVVKNNANNIYWTRLGSFNNREKQLKNLAKSTANRLANLYLQKKKTVGNENANVIKGNSVNKKGFKGKPNKTNYSSRK